MADDSLLSDDLLRHLVAVGHVDLLIGVPALNNAGTIARALREIHAGLSKHFPRARTVVVVSDGGSTDRTPEIVRDFSLDDAGTVTASHGLRTAHRISTPYHGMPGKGTALRMLFAAADLLTASALAVLDPEVETLSADWIGALVAPVLRHDVDFTAPRYLRAATEAPLVTQLMRPMVRATYGWRICEPLVGEFACSGRFAAHCVEHDVWTRKLSKDGIDLWIAGEALSGGFRMAQAALGPRVVVSDRERPGLPEVFRQLVGAAFDCLEMHQGYWLSRGPAEPLPDFGTFADEPAPVPPSVPGEMARSFAEDVANLNGVLASFLSKETLNGVTSAVGPPPRLSDELWARVVFESLLAYHRAVITREHVVRALLPLYLGRVASFWIEHAASPPDAADAALEALCMAFEQVKPDAAGRWQQTA